MYASQMQENPDHSRLYGIPQHMGLFYAMGLALVMEGLMSGRKDRREDREKALELIQRFADRVSLHR
jgi:hypothetical protein